GRTSGKVRGKVCVERRCCKEPIEATRIIRRANETLPDFKERWTQEMICILDVPVVMQISSFVNNSKCPELARRFADRVPTTIMEMMKRVDDFVKLEEAYRRTPRKENLDRYCDYHGEKGHYTNDCHMLKKQLEASLDSGKLNHLIKYVRQQGNTRGRTAANNGGRGKVINMVWENTNHQKRKTRNAQTEAWMDAPITFPSILPNEVSDDLLIIEAEVEGYLVKRVFVDQGAAIQVIFEHCFDNLPASVRSRLTATQIELVGFSGEKLLHLELRANPAPEEERAPEQEQLQTKEEAVLVNPAFPDQKVIIGTQFSEDFRS
ncbi:hypothetical protein Tco_1518948, partial [Tanacetum coccineum]